MKNEMIKIEDGFQYSVNIAYDLHNEKKLQSFIPTKSSLELLENILLSTNPTSLDRARVLVGAYGKGKSHILLAILSLLSGTKIEKFEKLKKKIASEKKLKTLIQNYSESGTKLLPVLITGTGNSISQNFLLALQRTLKENDLLDLMPETNFKAAIKTIERWQNDYPETFAQFKKEISDKNIDSYISKLNDFDNETYKQFEEIYPKLTSGSNFNPFLGFDVTEIYESVVKSLKEKTDYCGVYVVYDEFSKYLETNIGDTSVNDTKMLQDFAEKCNRSGENQIHLCLICHKEISNYIDNLPKQKVDGWRGISERFTHVHLNNNFTQTYEIIESVILKDNDLWKKFCDSHKKDFDGILKLFKNDNTFNDISEDELENIFKGCYPLHPLSIYILPRLSERVAQNERTLFTFLSSPNANGLVQWLKNNSVENVISSEAEKSNKKDASASVGMTKLLTPDLLYDYFEPLFKKEIYTEDLYKTYTLTTILLDKLNSNSLEAKIVKLLSLIYMLSQFERLSPTANTINNAFGNSYSAQEIDNALKNLIEKECIVYLRRSNNFYSLKQSSGVDINSEIQKMISAQNAKFSLEDTLNNCNFDKALYPLEYNDKKEMTRYFDFIFISENEITENADWQKRYEKYNGDGIVFALLLNKKASVHSIQEKLRNVPESEKCLFVVPKKILQIEKFAREYNAVLELVNSCGDDNVLRGEYEVVLDDLQTMINDFIATYTHPEKQESVYFYKGEKQNIKRKADLTQKLSDICDEYFSKTPVIINESVNKNAISTAALNARNKIISALLRNELEKNLGLTGGQELAIMRSLLVKTKIIETDSNSPKINLNVEDKNLFGVLKLIKDFVVKSKGARKSLAKLYEDLISDKKGIGLRKGVVPVFLACVFHEYKKQIVLFYGENEIPLSTDALCLLNEKPEDFSISFMDWGADEEQYIEGLSKLFSAYVNENEKSLNACDKVFNAMRHWYMDLPKYTRETKVAINGENANPVYSKFLKNLKQATNGRDFIFEKLRLDFLNIHELTKTKQFFDTALKNTAENFAINICEIFSAENRHSELPRTDDCHPELVSGSFNGVYKKSLCETLKTWTSKLKPQIFENVFDSGTMRFLNLCKNLTNAEDTLIAKQIAFIATDLNIEDWSEKTEKLALKNIAGFKEKIENAKVSENNTKSNVGANSYEINFIEKKGSAKTKRFEKTEISSRGKMLSHSLKSTIDGMGLAISDDEKRQVLIDLLIDLCGGE